ncbi:MAG: GAF domain-containing protein [Caldilineaceae bacterium]
MLIHFRHLLTDPYRPGNGPIVQPWIQPLRRNLLTFRRYWTVVSLLTFSLLIGLATLPIQNRWRDLGITAAAMIGYGIAASLFDLADRYTQGSPWQQRLSALRKFGVVLGLTAVHWLLPAASTELWLLYLIPMITVGVDLDRAWAVLLIVFTMILMFFSAWPLLDLNAFVVDWLVHTRNGAIRALIGGYIGTTSYLLARSLAYQTNTLKNGLGNLLNATIADRWLNAADTVAGVIANLLSDAKRHVTMNVLVYETANQIMRLIGSSTPAGQQSARAGFTFDVTSGITGWAAQQGKPCFINDTHNDPEHRFLPATAFPSTRSALAVPLKLDRKRSVVFELESTLPYDVAYEDLQLMNHVGHYLLTAHQRNSMLEFHQRLVQLGTALAERIIHVKEIGAMLEEIGAVALDLLEADVIRFYYRNPESAQIDQRCTIGTLTCPATEDLPMDQTHKMIAPLMEAARLQIFPDAPRDSHLVKSSAWHEKHDVAPFVIREGVASCAAMPLIVGQEKLGLMWVNYRDPQEFSPALQSSIQLLAPYAALAIKSSIQSALSERNRRVTMRRIVHDSLAHRLHDVVRGLERLDQCKPDSTAWKEERMIVQCQVERARRVVDNLIGERHWVTLQSVIDDLETQAQLLGKYHQISVKSILCKAVHTPISVAGGNELMFACDEIIGNVVRHSRATALSITAEIEAEQLRIYIADNGIGFDSSRVRLGQGIASIQDRIGRMNGSVEICSEPESGTLVYLAIPLTASNPKEENDDNRT